jgi:spermidine/putrescine transport system ATP-binding protein
MTAPSKTVQIAGTVLAMRDLRRAYGSVTAVDRVSLELRSGEFFSLIGPSGCGKTTTLRLIAGLETPSSGQILLGGKDVTNVPAHRRNVHTVFQNYALFPHLSVADNVAFGLRERKLPNKVVREKVARMMELVELTGREQARPRELSGGMQQRVALARSLVLDPAVLLLDEPLGALDLRLRRQMQLLLKTIQREVGITFVYVTHDQEEAFSMSDRVGVMSGGELVQVGTPREIYERPRTRFVADFVGAVNQLPARVLPGGGAGLGYVEADVALLGRLRPPAAPGVAGEAVCVVRPEVPVLSVPPAPDAHATFTVADVSFRGPQTSLTVTSADGLQLTLVVQSHHVPEALQPGEPAGLTIRQDDLWVIPS